jgi:hypothetical protein
VWAERAERKRMAVRITPRNTGGGAGGYSPLRAISVFRCTGVHTVAFKFFKVPVHAPGAFAGELNAFIAGHRVASVRKKSIRKKAQP